jgi:4-amino-4-deoxy-L-arabinose transferase-like glycosyltransferase
MMSSHKADAAPRSAWRLDGVAIVLILFALGIRLAFVFLTPRRVLFPDGIQYLAVAHSLVTGHGFGLQALRPPGYPAFVAAVWSVTGENLLALRLVEALVGTISVALIAALGARWFGSGAGRLALVVAAFHPVLAYLPSTQYSENLLVLVCVLAYGCLFEAILRPGRRLRWWIAGGVLLGVACLIRPNVVVLVPGLLLGAAWSLARAGRGFALPAFACVVALSLTLAPWLIRNHRVHGHWYFVAAGGGRSLWLGNNDQTSGRAGSIAVPDSALLNEMGRLPGDIAQDQHFAEIGLAWIKADPVRAARRYLVHMGSLWAIYPDTSTRAPFMNLWARLAQGVASIVIYLGALMALARTRDVPVIVPMAAAIVTFSLVNAVFFMVLRYRMPVEPLLIWMSAIGWTRVTTVLARSAVPGPSAPPRAA